jgi:integrase
MTTKTRKRTRGNGEGSVVFLGNGRKNKYGARVTVGFDLKGKQMVKYIGYFSTKTEAKKALNEYNQKPYSLEKVKTIDIFEKWSETAKITEEVIKSYKSVIEKSGLSNKVFKDIKLYQLEDYFRTLSPAMQKRARNAFKNIYIYGMKHEIVDKNLAELVELDKYVAKEKEAIKTDDIKYMLKHEDVIPTLLLYTGMRISELLSIESENVDIEKRILIGGLKTEAGKNRKIPIHKKIVPIIKELLENKTEYLITDNKGRQIKYSEYSKTWNNYEIIKNYTIHQTRHTFVSRAVKLGLDRSILQKVIGHSNKDVTDIYTHVDEEQLIQFIDAFSY